MSSTPPVPTDDQFEALTEPRRQLVLERVGTDLRRAEELVCVPLPWIPVRFDLTGTAAGMFCSRKEGSWFRFNSWLFARNFSLHLDDTVAHEVAHYAVHQRYRPRRIKPHGPEWRSLMVALGANPSATFKGDVDGVPIRRQRQHRYQCACREHEVSTTRHNRISAGRAQYRCRHCDQVLVKSVAQS